MLRQAIADRILALRQQAGGPGVGHVGQNLDAAIAETGDKPSASIPGTDTRPPPEATAPISDATKPIIKASA